MESYLVVGKKGQILNTSLLLHPGEVLAMEIEARGIKKSEFADAVGIKPGNLTELLKGKRHVSAMMALKFEALLEISAAFWLRVQSDYDLTVAKRGISKSIYSSLTKNRLSFIKKKSQVTGIED